MATVAFDAEGPGKGAFSPVRANMSRGMKIVTGKFSFDTSYPTGGEDLSEIFNMFAECHGVLMEQPVQAGAQTGKFVKIDHTAKKAMLFTNAAPFAEIANASDQSGIVNLRFFAWGM